MGGGLMVTYFFFFFQAEDGIRDADVTGVQTCALPICPLHTSGELFFDAPDRLEKKTLQPAAQDLIVEGDELTMVRGSHRRSMRVSDYPQRSEERRVGKECRDRGARYQ